MSLYRQPGRVATRTLALCAAAALALGLLGGYVLGRVTAPDPSLAEQIAELRTQLRPAENGLELTATEYGQAVRGGQVVEPTEYAAAKADVQRVRDTLAAAQADLRALDARGAAALEAAVAQLDAGVRERVDPAEVQQRSDTASRALAAVFGG